MWRALGGSHRRRILDLLRPGPQTTGDVARAFPDLSRFAVMQHLGVLEEAGLVLVRRSGRQRFNFLNAVPIQQIHERWVSRFAADEAQKSLNVKRYLEQEGRQVEEKSSVRCVRIESEIKLAASPEKVFAAMTTEQDRWYPYNYGGERLKRIVWEEKVGGLCYEDWGDGMGKLYGVVTYYDPPKAACLQGHLGGGISLEQWVRVEPDGDGSILKGSTVCFGEISDEQEQGIRSHGDLSATETFLREYVEIGVSAKASK